MAQWVRVLVLQTGGPEFKSPAGMVACVYKSSIGGRLETGRFQELAGQPAFQK